jgi:hypothetical protein
MSNTTPLLTKNAPFSQQGNVARTQQLNGKPSLLSRAFQRVKKIGEPPAPGNPDAVPNKTFCELSRAEKDRVTVATSRALEQSLNQDAITVLIDAVSQMTQTPANADRIAEAIPIHFKGIGNLTPAPEGEAVNSNRIDGGRRKTRTARRKSRTARRKASRSSKRKASRKANRTSRRRN